MLDRGGYRSAARRSIHSLSRGQPRPMRGCEVLRTSIGSLLDGMSSSWCHRVAVEEGVVRKAVEQRGFFHDLLDGAFNGGGPGVRQRVQVHTNNCNAVREFLCITTEFTSQKTQTIANAYQHICEPDKESGDGTNLREH